LKLAICDDIGTASYEYQLVAAAAVEILARFDAPFADRYGWHITAINTVQGWVISKHWQRRATKTIRNGLPANFA
jgi:hypothetical protein